MEESNKQNKLPSNVYTKLLQNEAELTNYLKYIRHRPQPNRIILTIPKHITSQPKEPLREKKVTTQIKPYIEEYLKLVKEANSLESYSGKKIIVRLIQYLEEFPTMGFLVQSVNTFGKEKKKLCTSQSTILSESSDQMIPLFQKVIEKVEILKKQAESKKLMELGQRIAHLQRMVQSTRKPPLTPDSPLRMLKQERVEKYLIMEDNIAKAQKNYGKFSQSFHKNQEVFSNINRVYQQITKAQQQKS